MLLFDLTLCEIAIRLLLGGGIGFLVGLSGVGGGILGLQATSLALGLDPIRAVGTTSLYLFFTNIMASFHHIRLKNVSWTSIRPILLGAVPANVVISIWISRQGENDAFKSALEIFILFVVFIAILAMSVNMLKRTEDPDASKGGRISNCKKRQRIGFVFGICFGGIVGASSIGGGILLIPALVLLGESLRHTVGSAIFITMTLTCITAVAYSIGGEVDVPTAATMATGSLIGVWLGSRCSVGIPEAVLKKIVLGLIISVALAMLLTRH